MFAFRGLCLTTQLLLNFGHVDASHVGGHGAGSQQPALGTASHPQL